MIRILHTADLHLGVLTYGVSGKDGINTRITDYFATLDELVAKAREHDTDAFIIAGDVFENERPDNFVVSEFAKRVRALLDAGISVVISPGNHETSSSVRVPSAIEIIKALRPQKHDEPNVVCEVIGMQPSFPGDVKTLGDLTLVRTKSGPIQILAMPYPRRSEILSSEEMKNQSKEDNKRQAGSRFLERIKSLAKLALPDAPSIFIGHFGLKEAELQPGKKGYLADDVVISLYDVTSSLSDSKAAFSYIALGHYHNPQVPAISLLAPQLEEDMDGESDELSGTNPCKSWDEGYHEQIPPDPDSLLGGKKPVKAIPCAYSGAPCRRDFQDGSRPRKYVIIDVSETGSKGNFFPVENARQLRQLTIEDHENWKHELEVKLLRSPFWGKAFEAFELGLGKEEILKALGTPPPIFRLRMPEEARQSWPEIRKFLESTCLFERITAPYYPPIKKEKAKLLIPVAESPLDAVKSYLSSQKEKDDFVRTNLDKIRENAEKIMQDAGAL